MGDEPDLSPVCDKKYAGIRFIFTEEDVEVIRRIKKTNPEIIVASEIHDITGEVQDSSTRFGYCLMQTNISQGRIRKVSSKE